MQLDHPFVSPDATVEFFEFPYRHFVIKNLMRPEIYETMCARFPEYIGRAPGNHGAVGDSGLYHVGPIYSMREEDCRDGYDFFVWSGWKAFVANVFNLVLNNHTAYSLHWHPGSPSVLSKSGWSHLDLSICSVVPSSKSVQVAQGCDYTDDTCNYPETQKVLRSVAMLYYFNNPENLSESDGGGTAVYRSYNVNDRVKTIHPYNNSLFGFEVGTSSYHGFVGANYNRSAMVQWFHSSPSYIVHRNLPQFKERARHQGELFERWKKESLWQLDMDPDYGKYFSVPFSEVLRS